MEAGKLSAIVRTWVDEMNAKNLDAVLALYADDADHITPASENAILQGKKDMRNWWETTLQGIPSLLCELRTITAQPPNRVVIEYKRCADDETTIMVAVVFEFNKDGLIAHSRAYQGC